MLGFVRFGWVVAFCLSLQGCVTLVAPYDPAVDQALTKLSENSAKFLANASAGGSEKTFSSKAATEYYAVSFNAIDLLARRAQASRGAVPCGPLVDKLEEESRQPLTVIELPDDYRKFDCNEVQLYFVRMRLTQLQNDHREDGVLGRSEIKHDGAALQTSIGFALDTLVLNKPAKQN